MYYIEIGIKIMHSASRHIEAVKIFGRMGMVGHSVKHILKIYFKAMEHA